MTMFGEFMLRPWLRGLCFIEGPAPDAGGGGGAAAEVPPPDAIAAIPDAGSVSGEYVKSDYDILSEEDAPPVKEPGAVEPGKEGQPEAVAAKTPEQIAEEEKAKAAGA